MSVEKVIDDVVVPAQAGGRALLAFVKLSAPYWFGPKRVRSWSLTAALILLGVFQVALAIRLNLWSADLFNALERRSSEGFVTQLIIFAAIVGGIVVVNAMHMHAKRALQFGWRNWMTAHIIGEWMNDGSQYRLALTMGSAGNPDGRISEDIRIATEAAVDMATSLFYCLLLLISFISILWGLSGVVMLSAFGFDIPIYGHMVWLTVLYAGGGSMLAMFIGRGLVPAADRRQTAEASMRSALVQGRDNAETIALAHSEPRERAAFAERFRDVARAWHNQSSGLQRLIMFSSAFSTLAGFLPILVSTFRYLEGVITLGGVMQTAQAFQQVTSALSWPVDNFPRLAEMRASIERVLELHNELQALAAPTAEPALMIRVMPTAGRALTAVGLALSEPDGRIISAPFDLEVAPGERVILSGDTRTVIVLCKAIAGVWPWGAGNLDLPDAPIFVLTETPYIPVGSLREVISYSLAGGADTGSAVEQSLTDAGLERLLPQIDEVNDWAKIMSNDELQRLGFARLFSHRPQWMLLDRAASTLDESAEQELMGRLFALLPDATILAADPRPRISSLFTRCISIERLVDGQITLTEEATDDVAEEG